MLKVLYAGSPEASAVTLKLLIENSKSQDFKIVGVLTNPPSAKGRHKDLIPTPVADTASENNIPVFTPEHLDSSARDEISKFEADILVCFAYGHIFGPKFLSKKGVATWKVKKSMVKKLKKGKKYKYKVTYGKDTVSKKITIKK